MEAPVLHVISDTAIRVSWMEPLQPNGRIISYSVYLDNTRIPEINSAEPASHVVNDLLPYTVYEFKVGGPSQPSL